MKNLLLQAGLFALGFILTFIVAVGIVETFVPEPEGSEETAENSDNANDSSDTANTNAEVETETLEEGEGEETQIGDTVLMHYTGTLEDGTKFDSSYDRGQPFEVTLGAGQVIQGWEQGVPGMKVGEKRKLTIPPELGYGAQQVGEIPPNSTLIFEVELIEIVDEESNSVTGQEEGQAQVQGSIESQESNDVSTE